MQLAFQHLNLFRNPFGTLPPKALASIAVVDISHLPKLLNKPRTAIQFLAPHGRGKTTNLLALHALLPEVSYTQLHAGDNPSFSACDVRFIDSVENLSRGSRKALYQATQSIALTTHKSLSSELKRNGYHVVTIKVSTNDPQVLQDIFNRRIEYARRGPSSIPQVSLDDIKFLKNRFKNDIRSMEHYLYDVFQKLEAPELLHLS